MTTERTALVAGVAGFIGTHLAETLLKRGERVIGVDNMIRGSRENVDRLKKNPAFVFREHDIAEPLDLGKEKLQFIYNFACPASPTDMERLRMSILRVCCFGSYHLLELARKKRARYIFASTSEVYGNPLEHPQKETYYGNVNITGIRAVYDEGKRYGETMLTVFHHEYGVETRTVRIFNTYGEYMRHDDGRAIPAFITQALRNEDMTIFGDGLQTRSIQYVSDLVRGILLLADSDVTLPVNIGNPYEITMFELAALIKRLAGSTSRIVQTQPLPEDDPLVRRPDISRAKHLLNWEPLVAPQDGLKRTIEWFRKRLFS
ncbi:MAG: NAD-dependent epimerase/dehydratase family protein [Patescibacteria group bacterium]